MLNTEPPCARSVTRVVEVWAPDSPGLASAQRSGTEKPPLMQGSLRGQLDLIALREHVCFSKLMQPPCKEPEPSATLHCSGLTPSAPNATPRHATLPPRMKRYIYLTLILSSSISQRVCICVSIYSQINLASLLGLACYLIFNHFVVLQTWSRLLNRLKSSQTNDLGSHRIQSLAIFALFFFYSSFCCPDLTIKNCSRNSGERQWKMSKMYSNEIADWSINIHRSRVANW